jgi:hypothetical protein
MSVVGVPIGAQQLYSLASPPLPLPAYPWGEFTK